MHIVSSYTIFHPPVSSNSPQSCPQSIHLPVCIDPEDCPCPGAGPCTWPTELHEVQSGPLLRVLSGSLWMVSLPSSVSTVPPICILLWVSWDYYKVSQLCSILKVQKTRKKCSNNRLVQPELINVSQEANTEYFSHKCAVTHTSDNCLLPSFLMQPALFSAGSRWCVLVWPINCT